MTTLKVRHLLAVDKLDWHFEEWELDNAHYRDKFPIAALVECPT